MRIYQLLPYNDKCCGILDFAKFLGYPIVTQVQYKNALYLVHYEYSFEAYQNYRLAIDVLNKYNIPYIVLMHTVNLKRENSIPQQFYKSIVKLVMATPDVITNKELINIPYPIKNIQNTKITITKLKILSYCIVPFSFGALETIEILRHLNKQYKYIFHNPIADLTPVIKYANMHYINWVESLFNIWKIDYKLSHKYFNTVDDMLNYYKPNVALNIFDREKHIIMHSGKVKEVIKKDLLPIFNSSHIYSTVPKEWFIFFKEPKEVYDLLNNNDVIEIKRDWVTHKWCGITNKLEDVKRFIERLYE